MDSSPMPAFEHPEIEHLDYFDLKKYFQGDTDVETSVDILEIWKATVGDSSAEAFEYQHRQDLPHVALADHLNKPTSEPEEKSLSLRILFLKSTPMKSEKQGINAAVDNTQVAVSKLTADYLITHLGVCPLFLSSISFVPWVLNTGNALFRAYNSGDRDTRDLTSIQGFYHCSDRGRPVHVWFQHSLPTRMSTYVIHGCPERVQNTIRQWASDPASRQHMLRPLTVDSLIVDDVTWGWSKAVVENATKLLEYEHYTKKENMERIDSAVQSLHHLSQHFHILQEELNGIVEQLDYLIGIHDLVSKSRAVAPIASVADSLRLLRSRTHKWHSSVTNWKERTQIRIHLFFNLSAQRDNLTNMNVAQLTSEIAKATYKDSSSMITIAILTLIFLPGTFVSGIFSMPFTESLVTRPGAGWQLYAAITVPLTFCVLLAWNAWRQYRDKSEPKMFKLQGSDEQEQPLASTPVDHPSSPPSEKGSDSSTTSARTSHDSQVQDPATSRSVDSQDLEFVMAPRTPAPNGVQSRFSDSSFEYIGHVTPNGVHSSGRSSPDDYLAHTDTADNLSRGSFRTPGASPRINSASRIDARDESRAQSRLSTRSRPGSRMAASKTTEARVPPVNEWTPSATPPPRVLDTPHSPSTFPSPAGASSRTSRPRSYTVGTPTPAPRRRRPERCRSLDRGCREVVDYTDSAKGSSSHKSTLRARDDFNVGLMEGKSRAAFDPREKFVGFGPWVKDTEASPVGPPRYSTPIPHTAKQQQQQSSKKKKGKMRPRSTSPLFSAPARNHVPNTVPKRGTKRPLSPDIFEVIPMTRLRYASRSPKPDRVLQTEGSGGSSKPRRRHGRAGRGNQTLTVRDAMRTGKRSSRSASPGRPVYIHPSPPYPAASATTQRSGRRSPSYSPAPNTENGVRFIPVSLDRHEARSRRSRSPKRNAFQSIGDRHKRIRLPRRTPTPLSGVRWDDDGTQKAWDVSYSRSPSPGPSPRPLGPHRRSRPGSALDAMGAMTAFGVARDRGRQAVRAAQTQELITPVPIRPGPFVIQPLPVQALPVTPNLVLSPPSFHGRSSADDGSASDSPAAYRSARRNYLNESPSPIQFKHSQGESSFSGTSTLVQNSPWFEGEGQDVGDGMMRSISGSWSGLSERGGKLDSEEEAARVKGNMNDDMIELSQEPFGSKTKRALPKLITNEDRLRSSVEHAKLDQSVHKAQQEVAQMLPPAALGVEEAAVDPQHRGLLF